MVFKVRGDDVCPGLSTVVSLPLISAPEGMMACTEKNLSSLLQIFLSEHVLPQNKPDMQPGEKCFREATLNLSISPVGAKVRRNALTAAQIIDEGGSISYS